MAPFILLLPRWFQPNGVVRQVQTSPGTGATNDGEMALEALHPDTARPLLDAPQTKAAGVTIWAAFVLAVLGLVAAIPIGWG